MSGEANNDVLRGGDGSDRMYGDTGVDQLFGENDSDDLFGGAGNDVINGGDGNDFLYGDAGRDILIGGAGADNFIFTTGDFAGLSSSTADRITDIDFAAGGRIYLPRVDFDPATPGEERYTFIGTAAFSGTAGEVRYGYVGGNTLISGDTDGDGRADIVIRLDGVPEIMDQYFLAATQIIIGG